MPLQRDPKFYLKNLLPYLMPYPLPTVSTLPVFWKGTYSHGGPAPMPIPSHRYFYVFDFRPLCATLFSTFWVGSGLTIHWLGGGGKKCPLSWTTATGFRIPSWISLWRPLWKYEGDRSDFLYCYIVFCDVNFWPILIKNCQMFKISKKTSFKVNSE